MKCGQARDFLCSNPSACKIEGRGKSSLNCLCEGEDCLYLFDVMNSVYDEVFTN